MRVGICGGGPAGLYLAILFRRAGHEVLLRERNPPGVTYGWGVVFSDESLADLRDADYETYLEIDRALVRWSSIDIHYAGELIRSTGHGFAAIARTTLLRLLAERAAALGADVAFSTDVSDGDPLAPFGGCDLVVAADSVRSVLRTAHAAALRTSFSPTASKYVWFGADFALPVFTFIFTPTPHGLFQVHSYPYDAHRSTFIVECSEAAWRSAGLDTMSEDDSLAFCQDLFAPYLGGHRLLSNESVWRTFVTVRNRSWHTPVGAGDQDLVLVGDAAHTAHFSIGSGTRLALDDAIVLAKAFLAHPDDRAAALAAYEGERQPVVERFQEVATDSAGYFESVSRYVGFAPEPFAFNLLTRSGRIGHGNLTARDPVLVNRVDRRFHGAPAGRLVVPPPLLTPLRLSAACELSNRVVMASGTLDVAVDGLVSEAHGAALGAVAATGAGLVVTEEVSPSEHGRVTTGTPGLWRDEHTEAWAKVAAAVHETGACLALRLTDAGRRGATLPRGRGLDRALPAGGWTLWAPAPLRYSPRSRRPEAIPDRGREIVLAAHVDAARRAAEAGVDVLLLDMSDGYLLASFLSPLSNPDDDDRSAFPLEVLGAVRAAWPDDRPLAVRLVADDRMPGGLTPADGVVIARRLADAGAGLIDVTAGHTVPDTAADYRRLFNAGLADRVRNEAGVAVIAGGHITRLDEVNTLLAAGRADLCRLDPRLYFRGTPPPPELRRGVRL
ncbi:MAG TPA: FAD-dependent monooxygenase [Acidimicrobiia bacterium]|nr:FAD-dependent monooxygenase [Acidimicrobiia bacterium]